MPGEILPLMFKVMRTVWRWRVQHFLLIWTAMTVLWASCTALAVWRSAPAIGRGEPAVHETNARTQPSMGYSSWMALTLLVLFLACYMVLLLKGENFAYYDNWLLTRFSLSGVNFPPPIWPQEGRFFPLAHQEFNLIQHFTKSLIGYHIVPMIQLLILSCTLLVLDKQLTVKARAGLAVLVLVTPGFVIGFGGLIYPERNIVFCLVCLLLFVKRLEESQRIGWAIAAVVSAQIMIYEKETAFLLVLGLAIGGLVFGYWKQQTEVSKNHLLQRKENRLYTCLALLTIPFLLYYLAAMNLRSNVHYNADTRLTFLSTAISYITLDLLAWLFAIFFFGRAYRILQRRTLASPFWDGVALGGVLCFAAYLYLGLSSAYYLAPVNLIAVLYVGRFLVLAWTQTRLWPRIAIGSLCTIVLLQNLALSAICLYQRKNLLHAKAAISQILIDRYRAGQLHSLFFPFADPYVVHEFAAYLSYRGVPIEEAATEFAGSGRAVRLSARSIQKDSRCVEWFTFLCHARSQPEKGDLVIVLPDDSASFADALPYRSPNELVFSYQPRPEILHALGPINRRIHIASHLFYPYGFELQGSWPQEELPDRWLDASIAESGR
jgi:hypothetical protein